MAYSRGLNVVKPTVIILPIDFLPVKNPYQQTILEDITKDIAVVYQIPTRKVSFKDLWRTDPPKAAEGKSLEAYLENVSCRVSKLRPLRFYRWAATLLYMNFITTRTTFGPAIRKCTIGHLL